MNERTLEILCSRFPSEMIAPDLVLVGQQLAVPSGRLDLLFRTPTGLLVVELKKGAANADAVKQVCAYREDLRSGFASTAVMAMVVAHEIPGDVAQAAFANGVTVRAIPVSDCRNVMSNHGITDQTILRQARRVRTVLQSAGTRPRAPITNEEAYRQLPPTIRSFVSTLETAPKYLVVSGGMHSLIHYRGIKVGGVNRVSPKSFFISSGLVVSDAIEQRLQRFNFRYCSKHVPNGEHSWWQSDFEQVETWRGGLAVIQELIDETLDAPLAGMADAPRPSPGTGQPIASVNKSGQD